MTGSSSFELGPLRAGGTIFSFGLGLFRASGAGWELHGGHMATSTKTDEIKTKLERNVRAVTLRALSLIHI